MSGLYRLRRALLVAVYRVGRLLTAFDPVARVELEVWAGEHGLSS